MQLKHFYFILGFVLVSNLVSSQENYDNYKESLKEMENMQSYFEEHQSYSNTAFIEGVEESNHNKIDSIRNKEEVSSMNNAMESGFVVYFKEDQVDARKIGLWTLKRKDGSVLSYRFYSFGIVPVGPSWWFGESGLLLEKRYWHPIDIELLEAENTDDKVRKEYYSQTFYENGNPKTQGDYSKGNKSGTWRYYSKNGQLKKEKYY